MFNPPNSLSLLRAPLALLFLYENSVIRIIAVILAMLTDFTDGYLARRYKYSSRFGAVLDPAMDKFFVFFVLGVFLVEKKLSPTQSILMISRDLFLCVFGLYLKIKGDWKSYKCKAVSWGKVTTAMQFAIIITLTLGFHIPSYTFLLFLAVGLLVFIELLILSRRKVS
jgi:CDP-diacylglycerol---glycerol-3-phosphate 3-phosphatidyltransferase